MQILNFCFRKIASAELIAADDEKVAGIFIISFIRKSFSIIISDIILLGLELRLL